MINENLLTSDFIKTDNDILFLLLKSLEENKNILDVSLEIPLEKIISYIQKSNPWEVHAQYNISPVDYILILSQNLNNPDFFSLFKTCLLHKDAPHPSTWSNRLIPLSHKIYHTFNNDVFTRKPDEMLNWINALAKGNFAQHIGEYCEMGGLFVSDKVLNPSPLLYLYPQSLEIKKMWFIEAQKQKFDLVQKNLPVYGQKWKKRFNLSLTDWGSALACIRDLRHDYYQGDLNDLKWQECLESLETFAGFKNTNQIFTSNKDLLKKMKKDTKMQNDFALAYLNALFNLNSESQTYYGYTGLLVSSTAILGTLRVVNNIRNHYITSPDEELQNLFDLSYIFLRNLNDDKDHTLFTPGKIASLLSDLNTFKTSDIMPLDENIFDNICLYWSKQVDLTPFVLEDKFPVIVDPIKIDSYIVNQENGNEKFFMLFGNYLMYLCNNSSYKYGYQIFESNLKKIKTENPHYFDDIFNSVDLSHIPLNWSKNFLRKKEDMLTNLKSENIEYLIETISTLTSKKCIQDEIRMIDISSESKKMKI